MARAGVCVALRDTCLARAPAAAPHNKTRLPKKRPLLLQRPRQRPTSRTHTPRGACSSCTRNTHALSSPLALSTLPPPLQNAMAGTSSLEGLLGVLGAEVRERAPRAVSEANAHSRADSFRGADRQPRATSPPLARMRPRPRAPLPATSRTRGLCATLAGARWRRPFGGSQSESARHAAFETTRALSRSLAACGSGATLHPPRS